MTQVTRKYNNKYINEAIPGTILRLNKTPYYPWPQDIQPNRNLKLIIQGIHNYKSHLSDTCTRNLVRPSQIMGANRD